MACMLCLRQYVNYKAWPGQAADTDIEPSFRGAIVVPAIEACSACFSTVPAWGRVPTSKQDLASEHFCHLCTDEPTGALSSNGMERGFSQGASLGLTCPEGEGSQGALQVSLVEVGPGRQVAPRVRDRLQHALLPHQLHKLLRAAKYRG